MCAGAGAPRPGDPRVPQQVHATRSAQPPPVTPSVTVPLGAKLLKVTPKAVDFMLLQLGGALPRELTGRRRYRAWGIV
ncbi:MULTISPECIES: helix-turn-helix domain-containing protein [Microvirga]